MLIFYRKFLTMKIAEALKKVRERIYNTAVRSGRDPQEIRLVAVTKTIDMEGISEAINAGVTILGENRVQEAQKKVISYELRVMGSKVEWHLIGHLQRNKAKYAVRLFDLIHTIDSVALAEEVNKQAQKIGKVQRVLIEVKLSSEEAKHGVTEKDLIQLVESIKGLDNLKLEGLMTMPPFFVESENTRPYFKRLRELRDRINELQIMSYELRELSMGMSHDFEIAIEEGATMVRIGTAIFGQRR